VTDPCTKSDTFDDIWKEIGSVRNQQAWKVGFWTMVAITTIAIPALVANVVNNDRIRASEDIRVQHDIDRRLNGISEKQIAVLQDVREIKTLLRGALGVDHHESSSSVV